MKCNKCGGGKVRTRTNYTHGRKSRSVTTFSCRICNSTDIEAAPRQQNRRRR